MTDQSQPDRPGGDGLLPCPLCQSSEIELGVCYAEGSSEKEPAARCARCGCRATLKAWNTRATQPARDAAEGAYEFPYNRTFAAIAAAVSLYPSKDAALGISVSVQKFQDAFNCHEDARPLAPPKPAPDAMREALDLLQLQQRGRAKAFRILDSKREISDSATLAMADAYEECANELKAALAAPVPPADGAPIEHGPASCEGTRELLTDLGFPSGTGAADPGLDKFKREVAAHYGAAEPVAWQPLKREDTLAILNDFRSREDTLDRAADRIEAYVGNAIASALKMIRARYAAPLVRGDREAIADIADELESLAGDVHENSPTTAELIDAQIDRFRSLSLPVQSVRPEWDESKQPPECAAAFDRDKLCPNVNQSAGYLRNDCDVCGVVFYSEDLSLPVQPGAGEWEAADQIIGDIEKRFPDWKSYRDLIDCIDVTLHNLRRGQR